MSRVTCWRFGGVLGRLVRNDLVSVGLGVRGNVRGAWTKVAGKYDVSGCSLWFCDATTSGCDSWQEVTSLLEDKGSGYIGPGDAASYYRSHHEASTHPVSLTPVENVDDFVDRWITIFAEATLGQLPST